MESLADRLVETELDDFGSAAAWAPGGELLAVGSAAGSLYIVDATTGAVVRWAGHEGGVFSVAWGEGCRTLFTGGGDGYLRAWDPVSRKERWCQRVGKDWVEHLALSLRRDVVAAAAGRQVSFFAMDGTPVGNVAPLESTVTSLFLHAKTKRFVASVYGGIRWLDSAQRPPVRTFLWKDSLLSCAQSPDGRWLAAPCQDTSVHIWDAVTGTDMAMTGFPGKVKCVAWSERGPTLATGCAQQITLWSFAGRGPDGTTGVPLRGHLGRVLDLAWTKKGQWLLSCSDAGELMAWRSSDGEALCIEDVAVSLERIVVCRDNQTVAVCTEGGGLLVLDLGILF